MKNHIPAQKAVAWTFKNIIIPILKNHTFTYLWYTESMTDLNKVIMEKAHQSSIKCNPDEQRKFLETFEERVIASCSISDSSSSIVRSHFKEILGKIMEQYGPVTVKISPELESSIQIFYLKTAKELGDEATIVSNNCKNSPFGIIIHSDHPVEVDKKELKEQFASLLGPDEKESLKQEKPSFWKKLFQ